MVIFVGFIGELAFTRTNLPSIIWLLLFGIALKPIVGVATVASFAPFSAAFAAIALIIILFDGGLNLRLIQVFREAPRSILLAGITFILSVTVITTIWTILGNPVSNGIILGTILGGTSSAGVIPIIRRVGVSKKSELILTIESAITDVLCVVFTIVALDLVVAQTFAISTTSHDIVSAFSIGGAIGLFLGIVWFFVLDRFKEEKLSYMITLAALLLLYAVVEYLKGSGAIACLIFFLLLGRKRRFTHSS